jgi:hypothetical protein
LAVIKNNNKKYDNYCICIVVVLKLDLLMDFIPNLHVGLSEFNFSTIIAPGTRSACKLSAGRNDIFRGGNMKRKTLALLLAGILCAAASLILTTASALAIDMNTGAGTNENHALSFGAPNPPSYALGSDEPLMRPTTRPVMPFEDVAKSSWYYSDVEWVYLRGLMDGTGDNPPLFSPKAPMTRAMLVTVLYRMQVAVPSIAYGNPFSDVPDGAYYTTAVEWAAANGIVDGVGDSRFAPSTNITREQTATILLNYAKHIGSGPRGAWATQLGFADTSQISNWAIEGAMYCHMNGIITGRPGGLFDPKGETTRSEIAAILHRFGNMAGRSNSAASGAAGVGSSTTSGATGAGSSTTSGATGADSSTTGGATGAGGNK